jgi:hypothetical protein
MFLGLAAVSPSPTVRGGGCGVIQGRLKLEGKETSSTCDTMVAQKERVRNNVGCFACYEAGSPDINKGNLACPVLMPT